MITYHDPSKFPLRIRFCFINPITASLIGIVLHHVQICSTRVFYVLYILLAITIRSWFCAFIRTWCTSKWPRAEIYGVNCEQSGLAICTYIWNVCQHIGYVCTEIVYIQSDIWLCHEEGRHCPIYLGMCRKLLQLLTLVFERFYAVRSE